MTAFQVSAIMTGELGKASGAIKEIPVLKIKLVKKLKESSTVASGAVAFGATKPEPKVEEEDDKKR